MRTTVRLDPELLREAKRLAAEERTSLTAVLEGALREMLARRREHAQRPRLALPTYSGRGLQAGVDLDDSAALLELMDRRDAPA
jgi:hypothetical protein